MIASQPLGAILKTRKGKKPRLLFDSPASDRVPYIDISAVEHGTQRQWAERGDAKMVPADSLVMVWDGARSGWVGFTKFEGALGSTLAALESPLDKRYLASFLRAHFTNINSHHRGSGIPHVNPDFLGSLEIPVLSESGQRLLAELSESVAEKARSAGSHLASARQTVDRLRQSILAAACGGRLTSEWRERYGDESAHRLLEETRQQSEAGAHTLAEPHKVWPEIPSSWTWATIEMLLRDSRVLSYGILKPGNLDPNGVRMVRIVDLGDGTINTEQVVRVSPTLAAQYERTRIEPGDILLAVMATVGRCAVAPEELRGANVNRALAVMKFSTTIIIPEFASIAIRSPYFQHVFASEKLGSAQARINLRDLRSFALPLPPLAEQAEIVRQVEQFSKVADRLKDRLAGPSQQIPRSSHAVLSKAFRGDLNGSSRANG
jgi:type I restriction enzyme, S subunit